MPQPTQTTKPAATDPFEAGRAACRAYTFRGDRATGRPPPDRPEHEAWINGWNQEALRIQKEIAAGALTLGPKP